MIKLKKVKPLYDKIIVTTNKYGEDEYDGAVIVGYKGELKPYQTVIATGTMVRNVKEGDLIQFSLDRYAIKQYDANSIKNDLGLNKTVNYALNTIVLDDVEHLILTENDVTYIIEDYEEIEGVKPDKSGLIIPKASFKV